MEGKVNKKTKQNESNSNERAILRSNKRNNINSISYNNSNPNNISSSSNRSNIWRRRINRKSKLWKKGK